MIGAAAPVGTPRDAVPPDGRADGRGSRGTGPVRRRVRRPRHTAWRWPYPAPYRGARWLRWWLLMAVLAGMSGALLTLAVLAPHWPH